eukprot:362474_1
MDAVLNKFETIEQRMNDLELRVNAEEKNDGFREKISQEIKSMKEEIKKLSVNNLNPEQQKLKSWLENQVKLPQYFDTFIENGIEDLSTASVLTMEGLKAMDVNIVGHQMKILSQVVKLNHNEGG